MKVKVANKIYRMGKNEYQKILKVASDQVPFGIYAIEKNDYAELMNIKCMTMTQLKGFVRQYKAQGFKVYSNRG